MVLEKASPDPAMVVHSAGALGRACAGRRVSMDGAIDGTARKRQYKTDDQRDENVFKHSLSFLLYIPIPARTPT